MIDKTTRRGIDRRSLLKYSAAGERRRLRPSGVYMPAIAQQKPIKIGFVSPQTGPLAAFAEADNFVLGFRCERQPKGGLTRSAAHAPDRGAWCTTANPIRTAPLEVAKELIVRDKIDLMLVG